MKTLRRRFAAALIVVGSVVLAPSDARADERWYGWQTLVSDGVTAAATVVVAKATHEGASAVIVAIGGYVVSPVVIHLAHEQELRALGSGSMRLLLPVACGFVGALASKDKNDGTGLSALPGFLIGLAVGIVAASTVDAAVLAYDDHPAAATSSAPKSSASPLKTLTIGGAF